MRKNCLFSFLAFFFFFFFSFIDFFSLRVFSLFLFHSEFLPELLQAELELEILFAPVWV